MLNAFERLLNESNLRGLQKGNGTAGKRQTFRSQCRPPEPPPTCPSRPGPPLRPDRRPPQAEVRDPGPRLAGTSAPTRPPRPCPTRWVAGSPGTSDPPPEVIGGRVGNEERASKRRAAGPTRYLRNLTSQPPYTGGLSAARSGAGLPAPA